MVKFRARLMSVALLVGLMLMASPVTIASAHGQSTPKNVPQPYDSWWCAPGNGSDFCNGQDPSSTGCANDGQTIASFVVKDSYPSGSAVAYNELRWSAKCGTNWVRMTATVGFSFTMKAKILNYCSGSPNYGSPNYSASTYNPPAGTVIWTPMIYAPHNSVTMEGSALAGFVSHCY